MESVLGVEWGHGNEVLRGVARTMHEPPATTADLAVLPGVLGS
ncbi:MAG TPA: hypothetical protein VEI04_00515 [Syntrophobacteria bacterium]|nr:hypothetical protein [Syntrophobacteria bacterium]